MIAGHWCHPFCGRPEGEDQYLTQTMALWLDTYSGYWDYQFVSTFTFWHDHSSPSSFLPTLIQTEFCGYTDACVCSLRGQVLSFICLPASPLRQPFTARWSSIIDDPSAPPPPQCSKALCTAEQRQVQDLVGGQDCSTAAGLLSAWHQRHDSSGSGSQY